jgi:hypothetical protein
MSCRFDDVAPDVPVLTPYDEAHLIDYLRLLDADADGADWQEAVAVIFDIDPAEEPYRAQRMYATHLARARWMTEVGYAHLLARDGELKH